MSQTQREHYDGADEIGSDPFHVLDRDNRNHQKKLDVLLDHTTATTDDRVLEVGCGDGLHARRLARRFRYTGVDISESLLAAARERTPPDATFKQADATALPFDDDAFDAVVGTAILHHIADQADALREWRRVVAPGGSVTLMEPNALFPKDLLTAFLVPAERHKRNMVPWRLRETLQGVADTWTLSPAIYTPPWPASLADVYDHVDSVATRLPGLRWGSQMLCIHIEC